MSKSTRLVPRLLKHNVGKSMTKQSCAAECEISNIIARHAKTGLVSHLNTHHGSYEDFTEISDFHTSMNLVTDAQQMFMTLPSGIRARFGNDPGAFLDFASDPENYPEMVSMGLAHSFEGSEAAEAPQDSTSGDPLSDTPPLPLKHPDGDSTPPQDTS